MYIKYNIEHFVKEKIQKKYKSIIKVLDSFRTKYKRFAKGKNDKFTTKLDKYLEKIGHILWRKWRVIVHDEFGNDV